MRTKQEALDRLAALPLRSAVRVVDPGDPQDASDRMDPSLLPGPGRRAYRFTSAAGYITTIEIDANPTPAQLADLARHLPVAEKDRAAALEVLAGAGAVKADAGEPVRTR